jgi:hypothetical protein
MSGIEVPRRDGAVFCGRSLARLSAALVMLFPAALMLPIAPASAQPAPPAPEAMRTPSAVAHAAVNFFAQGCAAHFGSAARIEGWARQQNFGPARPDVAAMFSPDAETSAWVVQMTGLNIAMVFRHDGLQCRIYAQGADVDVARSYFISVMEGARRPGVVVEKEAEGEQRQGDRRVWQIGYRLRGEVPHPNRPDRLLLLTLNPAANARFAVIATVALVPPR